MRLALTGRHVDITSSLRQLVTRRLARLERLLNDHALSTQVVLSLEKRHHNTEITVHARGDHLFTAKASAATWPQSIGEACDKVVPQAMKAKEKWVTRKRRATGGKTLGDGAEAEAIAATAPTPRAAKRSADLDREVVTPGRTPAGTSVAVRAAAARAAASARAAGIRTVRYAVKPMSIEDATLRVEEAREGFVVFRHAETERITILFQRPDGRLGLIDPES